MIKYEVRTFNVETKNGINAHEKWINEIDQTTKLVGSFDSLEEAQKAYLAIDVECRYMGGYWLHAGKCIEVNVYDDNGEWVEGEGSTCSGEWDCYELPNKKRYFTADRQTGTFIDEFDTYEQAEQAIEEYEDKDKEDEVYEPNFYAIVDEDHCTLYN